MEAGVRLLLSFRFYLRKDDGGMRIADTGRIGGVFGKEERV